MTTALTPAPAKPLPVTDEGIFILYYRQGSNPHPMQKHFRFPGDFRAAIERGKAHCENLGYRFISVRPFIVSLEADEKRENG